MMPPVDLTRTTTAGVCIQTKPHDLWRVVHRNEVRNALRNTQIGEDDTASLYGWTVDGSDCDELIHLMDHAPDRKRAS